jgi:hypothetical protein
MEVAFDQAEFFDFPRIEAKKSVVREVIEATGKHGPLLPQYLVVAALKLSKQRVSQLIDQGKLAVVEIDGRNWIPAQALELFLSEERRAGRPCNPTLRECIGRTVEAGMKERQKKSRK